MEPQSRAGARQRAGSVRPVHGHQLRFVSTQGRTPQPPSRVRPIPGPVPGPVSSPGPGPVSSPVSSPGPGPVSWAPGAAPRLQGHFVCRHFGLPDSAPKQSGQESAVHT